MIDFLCVETALNMERIVNVENLLTFEQWACNVLRALKLLRLSIWLQYEYTSIFQMEFVNYECKNV